MRVCFRVHDSCPYATFGSLPFWAGVTGHFVMTSVATMLQLNRMHGELQVIVAAAEGVKASRTWRRSLFKVKHVVALSDNDENDASNTSSSTKTASLHQQQPRSSAPAEMLTVEPFASDDNHHGGGGWVTHHVTLVLICTKLLYAKPVLITARDRDSSQANE